VADWHALTTGYENPVNLHEFVTSMVIDWLGAGLDPQAATLFVQSQVPEHAELHLLLSMITPLGWLERVPTYKDQQEQLKEKDLATYGFLGYPLLQSADILLYRPAFVPVGEDQVAHVEITREVARRFNHLYGREADFAEKAEKALKRLGAIAANQYLELRKAYQQSGDAEALAQAGALISDKPVLTIKDQERLRGYLEGTGRMILPEPEALLTATPKVPGLDGRKMSKSYNNTIGLREDPDDVAKKLRAMITDPKRARRTDVGEPNDCPVFDLHRIYSDQETQTWAQEGCRSAGIGCLDCKKRLIDVVVTETTQIRERAQAYQEQPQLVTQILEEGCERARVQARETMQEVREAMGLEYP
jgi:tryptophanyl-tRNA synthetase